VVLGLFAAPAPYRRLSDEPARSERCWEITGENLLGALAGLWLVLTLSAPAARVRSLARGDTVLGELRSISELRDDSRSARTRLLGQAHHSLALFRPPTLKSRRHLLQSSHGGGRLLRSAGDRLGAIVTPLVCSGFLSGCSSSHPYINVDPGTIFGLTSTVGCSDRGRGETDLDPGHYDRVPAPNTSRSFQRDGRLDTTRLSAASAWRLSGLHRSGRTPQSPMKSSSRMSASPSSSDVDFVITRIGGPSENIESLPSWSPFVIPGGRGPRRVLFIHLTLVPYIDSGRAEYQAHAALRSNELRTDRLSPDMVLRPRARSLLRFRKKIAISRAFPSRRSSRRGTLSTSTSCRFVFRYQ